MSSDLVKLPGEVWKPIPGYEGKYEVSSLGRVFSIRRKRCKGGLLKLHIKSGYEFIEVWDLSNKPKQMLVHRLVLLAFAGPCPPGMEGAHNNGIRTDNRAENLRWATKSENEADKRLHGNYARAVAMRRNRLKPDDVSGIRANYRKLSQQTLAKKYGVSRATIQRIHSGERHQSEETQ